MARHDAAVEVHRLNQVMVVVDIEPFHDGTMSDLAGFETFEDVRQ